MSLRLKRLRRNKAAKNRQPLQQAKHPNHIWGMDFVSDALFDGRRLCLLTIIDLVTRECLGIVVGQSLKGHDVQEALTAIARLRGSPEVLKTDNGSEFARKVMDRWAYERNIEIDFSRFGKPADNATLGRFSGRAVHPKYRWCRVLSVLAGPHMGSGSGKRNAVDDLEKRMPKHSQMHQALVLGGATAFLTWDGRWFSSGFPKHIGLPLTTEDLSIGERTGFSYVIALDLVNAQPF